MWKNKKQIVTSSDKEDSFDIFTNILFVTKGAGCVREN